MKRGGAVAREKKKGSGKWYVIVNFEGKQQAKLARGGKKEAENTAALINQRIMLGTFNLTENKKKTFLEYAEIWLQHSTIKPATKKNYESILHVHLKNLNKPIDKITKLDVKNFLKAKLASGLSLSTVKNIRACMSGVFDAAVDDGAIPANPASRIGRIAERSQESHKTSKPIFLSKAQLSKLLDTFAWHLPQHYALCLTLARTGMRIGEAISLQWTDIDFEKRVIHVQRGKSRTVVDTPKSGHDRYVDMSLQLCEVLKNKRLDMLSQALKTGKRSKWVFPGRRAELMNQEAWKRKNFDRMVKLAGLPHMRVHDLRHTYASMMIELGHPLVYISRQLGHHSISITVDLYGHLLPSDDRSKVDALDDERKGKIPEWKES